MSPVAAASSNTLVLGYHGVSPRWPAELSVTPQRLTEQLQYLVDNGYRGVTFSEAVLGEVTGRAVAVTFDDGYRSIARLAGPILERFGMPGTAFLPTDFVGDGPMPWSYRDRWIGSEHEPELTPMSWDEARSLSDSGWEIGSHTKSHPRLTELSDAHLEEELLDSRRVCESMLETTCRSLSYPYSDLDDRVVEATARAGYSAAATLPSRAARLLVEPPFRWPRVCVFRSDGPRSFRLKVSPATRRLRGSRAWAPVSRAARSLRGR